MAWILYEYKNCDSCRKARKFLEANDIPFERRPIRETPPSISELTTMLTCLDAELRRLFNTSGGSYREGNFKERLPQMEQADALAELAADGNLIKRPFFLNAAEKRGTTGFKEDQWRTLLGLGGR